MTAPLPDSLLDQVHGLTLACLSGEADSEDVAHLEGLLLGSEAARRVYLDVIRDSFSLRRWAAAQRRHAGDAFNAGSSDADFLRLAAADADLIVDSAPLIRPPSFTLHGPFGAGLLSYGFATVFTGLMLLILWTRTISRNSEIAKAPAGARADIADSRPPIPPGEERLVGRITGLADCRWADSQAAPPAAVPLGRKYELASGLMEIAYRSGAKVILQGPCTYMVDSPIGGFLSLGKLTARVEKLSAVSGQQSEIPNPKSQISKFVVRTPLAVVTDLGTEFGVEVNQQGEVAAHVLQGKIEVRPSLPSPLGRGVEGGFAHPVQLVAGESVRVLKGTGDQGPTMVRGKADAGEFAARPGHLAEFVEEQRLKSFRRWQAYSRKLRKDPSLLAYYSFESRGRDPTRDQSILPNVAATGEALDARIEGPRWAEGRFPGKSALRFSGPEFSDRVELPQPERFHFTGAFSVAVWFQIAQFTTEQQTLVAKGDSEWRVQWYQNTPGLDNLSFHTRYGDENGGAHEMMGSGEVANGRWHLAVAVWAPADGKAVKRLYLDGRLDAEGQSPLPLSDTDEPVWLGDNSTHPERAWNGLIDEVAVFSRALSENEVREMYVAGKPAGPEQPQRSGLSQLPTGAATTAPQESATQGSAPAVASRAVPGAIIYSDEAAFNAVVSNPVTITFSGLTSNRSYTQVPSLTRNGFSFHTNWSGGGLYAVNNAWNFAGTGKEAIEFDGSRIGTVTFPAGKTALGMELYAAEAGHAAKFTITFSDGTTQDFTSPVLPFSGANPPSFWGIVSTNPAVTIVSMTAPAKGSVNGILYESPFYQLMTAGTYVPEPGAPGKNPGHSPRKLPTTSNKTPLERASGSLSIPDPQPEKGGATARK